MPEMLRRQWPSCRNWSAAPGSTQIPKFVVEIRYEWAFGKKAIRGLGVTGKGGPRETPIEAILGQDPVNKTVYYLDCHGGDNVFKGTVKLEGEDLVFEFATIIGKPAKWRETLAVPRQGHDAIHDLRREGRSMGPCRQADLKTPGSRKPVQPSRLPKA